jgi:SAM-dependent methyltransferase
LIANHVLEHVHDDKRAMKECYRVLKKGGVGILSVPLSGKTKTWEPPVGMSVPEIEAIVGWDHKRFYGYDFAQKLEKFGFEVEVFKVTADEAKLYGIASALIDYDIFIAKK